MSRASELSKKSLVINSKSLRRWVKLGGFRTESEAVRAAVEKALAIRDMQDAMALPGLEPGRGVSRNGF